MKMCIKKVEGISGLVYKISSAGFAVAKLDKLSKVYAWDIRLQNPGEESKEDQRLDGVSNDIEEEEKKETDMAQII